MSDGEKQEVLRLCRQRLMRNYAQISQRHQTNRSNHHSFELILRILLSYLIRGSDYGSAYTIAPQGPEFSRFVMGYWRLMTGICPPASWSVLLKSIWISGDHRGPC